MAEIRFREACAVGPCCERVSDASRASRIDSERESFRKDMACEMLAKAGVARLWACVARWFNPIEG